MFLKAFIKALLKALVEGGTWLVLQTSLSEPQFLRSGHGSDEVPINRYQTNVILVPI